MSYKKIISQDQGNSNYPRSLIDSIINDTTKDVSVDYSIPEIKKEKYIEKKRKVYTGNINNLRLPARINNPLIPYPTEFKEYINLNDDKLLSRAHDHHFSHITTLVNHQRQFEKSWDIGKAKYTTSINDLKQLVSYKFSSRTDMIHQSAMAFAARATKHELSIMARTTMNSNVSLSLNSPTMSLLVAMQRLRVFVSRANDKSAIEFDYSMITETEPGFKLFKDGTYIYGTKSEQLSFLIIVQGGHFCIYHQSVDYWFFGPMSYLDYMFTVADIFNNMRIIRSMGEYNWLNEFLSFMEELMNTKYDHNTAVDFMKNFEGFLLNLSDYDTNYAMNWKPIMESIESLWHLDKKLCNVSYDLSTIIALIDNKMVSFNKDSLLCKITNYARNLTRTQMQELSSLHKFIYYAEIDARAGVMKFLKRVHTKRPIDTEAVRSITRLAKSEFYISYVKKHKTIPNLLGDADKITWLKVQTNMNRFTTISSLPLTWWDGIKIYNCMDNTLTDDALEFAKDKGALKSEIHLGPGDSRKELLQVIEQENYKLKDLLLEAPFHRQTQSVKETCRQESPINSKHPARLIEKEREQKIEARLFGNAELSDKHALSVITTKMKKVLSYFGEQLMTPSDSNRKKLIHKAAQMITSPNNYSLLLDIEGHNQSMQYENTAELTEFCGELFGENNWETLPNYFSNLDVFHYDEYLDKVILSKGQFGGIEGWMNPLWTLHTSLCVKLLRSMTSVSLPLSMTYSDDINAIIEIPQASNASVQSTFQIIMSHFIKFGMIVKMSQTNLSKHRVTILRQHYSDGVRADATLKKLIATSGANNPMLMADGQEVSGICSSIASALELSNHIQTCIYLKNYKLGFLLSRFTHSVLSRADEDSMVGSKKIPTKLASLLFHIKDDTSYIFDKSNEKSIRGAQNDVAEALGRKLGTINKDTLSQLIVDMYHTGLRTIKWVDSAERVLYLQNYSEFLQDLLFYWIYMPESLGGLGGTLSINLILSGHSSGFSKALHYLKEWVVNFSSEKFYFLEYMSVQLSIDFEKEINLKETTLLTSYWPTDKLITTTGSSINSSIKSMIKSKTKNRSVLKLFEISDQSQHLQSDILDTFRNNYHQRIAQFYYENSAVHFIDLLINKIETSSGLLTSVKSLSRLRNSLVSRNIENIRLSSRGRTMCNGLITHNTDLISYLIDRRQMIFPDIKMIKIDEPLYDDRIMEVDDNFSLLTLRQCSPQHYSDGLKIYDDIDFGNEIRYKGELIDDDRMLGNKEELLAAKLVAVTKWLIAKFNMLLLPNIEIEKLDCVVACNLSLKTLTGQTLNELWNYSPNEIGGEILHRIPNMRFSTKSYIRSDLMRQLRYTVDINQYLSTEMDLVDSNVNFDYLRLRILLMAMIRDIDDKTVRFKMNINLRNLLGIVNVQFIQPKPTEHSPNKMYICYGTQRGHTFSILRYRFLASFCLITEDGIDLAFMPKTTLSESTEKLYEDLIDDMVFNYSKSLDNEYMSVIPNKVDISLWQPLLTKIEKINPKIMKLTDNQKIDMLQDKLTGILRKKRRMTIYTTNDRVKLGIQTQCLEYLKALKPKDIYYYGLINRYRDLLKFTSNNSSNNRLYARYSNILNSNNNHKESLAIVLICEYVLTFHFQVNESNGYLYYDSKQSLSLLDQSGIQSMTASLFHPELIIEIMILGADFIESTYKKNRSKILAILDEISDNNNLADMVVPSRLPNLVPQSKLSGDEYLDPESKLVYYEKFEIPLTAMASISDMKPLLEYIRNCSDIGSSPYIYESMTGSDSYAAQYGLFGSLKSDFGISSSTRICDLTAGRGDFQYATRDLDLNADSFSIIDTFTMSNYHPQIRFKSDYDVFDTMSLKFISLYDWIHIDISFVGRSKKNILDLILFMEERNLAYSLRLNSIDLYGYSGQILEGLPQYDHYLYSPSNMYLKPYQIYLVGVPGSTNAEKLELSMKQTPAYRSIALSYSRLLSPYARLKRCMKFQDNSATIYVDGLGGISNTLKMVSRHSFEINKNHYLARYTAESIDNNYCYLQVTKISKAFSSIIEEIKNVSEIIREDQYIGFNNEDIGTVSEKSRPYHEKHLLSLQQGEEEKIQVDMHKLEIKHLECLRSIHPVSSIRRLANVHINLHLYFDDNIVSNRRKLIELAETRSVDGNVKSTLHQMEYQIALKLLLLSANSDDYLWGVNYCHMMFEIQPVRQKHYRSILKIYRMLSGYYDDVVKMCQRGFIGQKELSAIKEELLNKTISRVQYNSSMTKDEAMKEMADMETLELELDFDNLLSSLEQYANSKIEIEHDYGGEETLEQVLEENQIQFDIDISKKIHDFLKNNPDMKQNKFGMIDLGDEIDDWDEDLM